MIAGRLRAALRAAAALLTVVVLASVSSPAAAATSPLLGSEQATVVHAPAPGHAADWEVAVTNVSGAAVPLAVVLRGAPQALLAGQDGLRIKLTEPSGRVVVAEDRVESVIGRTIELPELAAGSDYRLTAEVSLPRSAGNEYQGLSADLVIEFVSLAQEGPAAGGLASTGVTLGLAVLAATALSVTGLILVIATRRRRNTV